MVLYNLARPYYKHGGVQVSCIPHHGCDPGPIPVRCIYATPLSPPRTPTLQPMTMRKAVGRPPKARLTAVNEAAQRTATLVVCGSTYGGRWFIMVGLHHDELYDGGRVGIHVPDHRVVVGRLRWAWACRHVPVWIWVHTATLPPPCLVRRASSRPLSLPLGPHKTPHIQLYFPTFSSPSLLFLFLRLSSPKPGVHGSADQAAPQDVLPYR